MVNVSFASFDMDSVEMLELNCLRRVPGEGEGQARTAREDRRGRGRARGCEGAKEGSVSAGGYERRSLDGRKRAFEKQTCACRNARFKNASVSKNVEGFFKQW